MPKKFLRRHMPTPEKIRSNKGIQLLGDRILNPNLWHLNRHSVTRAVAMGLVVAFIPMPGQMFVAAVLAIIIRCNLPIAALMAWVTNPLTWTPIYFLTYKVGATLLQLPPRPFEFEPTWQWFVENGAYIWKPLYLGSIVSGIVIALVASLTVNLLWRLHVTLAWRARKRRRMKKHA